MRKQLFIWGMSLVIMMTFLSMTPSISAQPSVETCIENPKLEGCGDDVSSEEQDEGESSPSSAAPSNGSMALDLVKLVLALAFIIFLIYVLLKFMNNRNKRVHPSKALENLGGVPLGQQKSLQIVRIGKQVYAVGVGENVELVTEITDQETIQELTKQDEQPTSKLTPTLFKQVFNKYESSDSKSGEDQHQSFQKLFQSELSTLKEKRQQMIKAERRKKEDSNE